MLTVSDGVHGGTREDLSGEVLAALLAYPHRSGWVAALVGSKAATNVQVTAAMPAGLRVLGLRCFATARTRCSRCSTVVRTRAGP